VRGEADDRVAVGGHALGIDDVVLLLQRHLCKPELLAPATVPRAAPEAAPIPAPRPPPTAPPIAAPSAVVRMAPPTAWLLAAYAAGAVCDAAYCWQKA